MKAINLKKVLDVLGGQVALAKICGVTQPTVHYWIKTNKLLAAEHVLKVEEASKRQLSRHDLRPDIFDSNPQKFA